MSTYDLVLNYRAQKLHDEYGFVLTDVIWGEALELARHMGTEAEIEWFRRTPLLKQVTTFWPLVSGEVH